MPDPAPLPALPVPDPNPYTPPEGRLWRQAGFFTQDHRAQRSAVPAGTLSFGSYNVNSLKSLLEKDPLSVARLVATEQLDFLAVQETRLQKSAEASFTPERLGLPPGWHRYWSSNLDPEKLGQAGTAVFARYEALAQQETKIDFETDGEGRVQVLEFEGFHLFNVYAPQPGMVDQAGNEDVDRLGLRIQPGGFDEKLSQMARHKEQTTGKRFIMLGDMNVIREYLDTYQWLSKPRESEVVLGPVKTAFETWELGHAGMVDTFRARYPGLRGYTWWGYAGNSFTLNRGVRLDYALVSSSIAGQVVDVAPLPHARGSSDHCPLVLKVKGLAAAPLFSMPSPGLAGAAEAMDTADAVEAAGMSAP